MEFVHQAIGLIAAHKAWAALLVGGLAFGESVVLIGVLVPATAVLVVVGGLIGAGIVDPWPVILGAATGATLGDAVSYYVGAWIGRDALDQWPPLDRYRDGIARARTFFSRFGFIAVFLGRFLGPVQATVPLAAGAMGMDARRFQIANVLSAILWAPLVLSPGWLIARSWRRLIVLTEIQWLRPAAVIALAAAVIALVAIRFYMRSRARAAMRGSMEA
jgi:membrane protein DedA with SNARE-associated domain